MRAKYAADSDPLVEAAVQAPTSFSQPVEPQAQLARLTLMRTPGRFRLGDLLDQIEHAIDTQSVSDEDIAECMYELLSSPAFQADRNPDVRSDDGWTHFDNVRTMKRLWEIAAKAGKRTGVAIASYAPLREERESLVRELSPRLPEHVVGILVYRDEAEIGQLIEDVRAHPDRYTEPVRTAVEKELKLLDEYGSADTDARREKRLRDAPNRLGTILDAILEVRAELKSIKELVTNPPKRGLFG